jgi:hypothetical protein
LKNAFQMMNAAAKKTPDELNREKRDAKAKAKAKAAEREGKERLEALQALRLKQEREREESEAALTRQRWSSQPWRSPDMVTITLKFHLTRSHNLCDATGLTFKRRENTSDLTGDLTPALVDSVASGDSGCESGDWITHINGVSTESPLMNLPDLEAYLHRIFFTSNRHGTGATLTVRRQGRSRCTTMATTPSSPARPPTAPTGPTGPAPITTEGGGAQRLPLSSATPTTQEERPPQPSQAQQTGEMTPAQTVKPKTPTSTNEIKTDTQGSRTDRRWKPWMLAVEHEDVDACSSSRNTMAFTSKRFEIYTH